MVNKTTTTTAKSEHSPRKPASNYGAKLSSSKTPKKSRVVKKKVEVAATAVSVPTEVKPVDAELSSDKNKPVAKYIFATGRRKTSVANIRLFEGHGKLIVNKKPLENYFQFKYYQETALKPFNLTGLGKRYYFSAHINGGGIHSQAQALRHGIAVALSNISAEIRKVLKKNGLLTRDDRKKERKKPGLKRARRAPQWAKR